MMKNCWLCIGLLTVFFSPLAPAATLDDLGVTAWRAVTTNLDGSGIRVAQPEAAAPSFEVNPAAVGQPPNRFTYYSNLGRATNFPNSVGSESGHANGVAANFYGRAAGVATNVAQVDSYDADFFITNYVFTLTPMPEAAVVNQSFTFGVLSVADQQEVDSAYDDYTETWGTLFVSAACNAGISRIVCAPGTAYNCLSVGAYANGTYYNSIGPTIDNGRCKPDITALDGATSFSTPQVAGVAAVLMQAAWRGDGGSDTNAAFDLRTIKALLLNGAVKPLGWTNSPASPLDLRYGAGVVNGLNAYAQLAGGQQGYIVSDMVAAGAAHPPTGATGTISVLSGWDFNTNVSSAVNDGVGHYYFNVSNAMAAAPFTATATLVWNRQKNQTNINDLNLFLYDCANSHLVTCSTSRVDNVEHIYQPDLAPGRYDLQVWKAGGAGTVSSGETYALAFAFLPLPELAIAKSGTNTLVSWPVYPAGFRVETAMNLISPVWGTSGLSASAITNSRNSLRLNLPNANQFFRLRSPNL